MAKIVTTRGISYHLERLIIEARSTITLVTPYLKIPKPIFERLVRANAGSVEITIVYGKTQMSQSQEKLLNTLDNCRIIFVENLHAKAFISDQCGIIGSMNLYDFSEINNQELGVYFTRKDDLELWEVAINEVDNFIESGKIIKETSSFQEYLKEDDKIDSIIKGDKSLKIEEFPIKGIYVDKSYGFVTYNFVKSLSSLKDLKQENFERFKQRLGKRYRVFWDSPFNRICIYEKNNILFTNDDKEFEYHKIAIIIANEILREIKF
nr:phospholipase D-like domain-containing protein [uncultured Psychroserpens sp.]